jgi:SAM-dependent methyltransferase
MISRGKPVEPWNHNIAYFPFIEKVAKARPRRSALDVGTGDGMLAARLAASIPLVVGLDLHQEQVDGASVRYPDQPGLSFLVGDVLDARLADAPFDFVVCSSTLHHFDLSAGLARLVELTAPGGTLVIVGLARNSSAIDWILSGLSVVPVRIARLGRGWHDHGAPKRDPHDSWTEIRTEVLEKLPGSTFRRRLYWRYSVVWNRPASSALPSDEDRSAPAVVQTTLVPVVDDGRNEQHHENRAEKRAPHAERRRHQWNDTKSADQVTDTPVRDQHDRDLQHTEDA